MAVKRSASSPESGEPRSPFLRTYKIVHREELIGWYYVEATGEEEAIEKFNEMACNGEVDFSDLEITESSDEAVLDEWE
jgi:hypothetical protein